MASAKPERFVIPGGHEANLCLHGTNGYEFSLSENNRGNVELSTGKRGAEASYLVHDKDSSADVIDAVFPGLGRISVTFQPRGEPRRPEGFPGCKGRDAIAQYGSFRGTLKFRGEQGYTEFDEIYARGKLVESFKEICKASGFQVQTESSTGQTAGLTAQSGDASRKTRFLAVRAASTLPETEGIAAFIAVREERRHAMKIVRTAFAFADTGAFLLTEGNGQPFSATISPPAPFRGSGIFRRNTDSSSSWTGGLAIALPGAGQVHLTGRSFKTSFCRDAGCRFSQKRQRRQLRQGSGSHSQAFWDARLSWSR
jgi:hypothetical protein